MRNHLSSILAALLALVPCTALLAQSTAGDPVVMTINGVDIPRSEFEYSYNKNNGDGIVDKKTVSEYVELFVNYKLKVCAALDARLDTTKAFREEYALYRDQQVRPTMVTDADVLAEARRAYERMSSRIGEKGLILPAHILIALSTKATLAEQDRAKQRIDSIYNALLAGADFSALAKRLSDDRASAARGGLLQWIAPNQTFKEFEETAYALRKGELSRPVLTPVGWHIIFLKDRKQLEPFDSLRTQIVTAIERQNIRQRIVEDRLQQTVNAADGRLTAAQIMAQRADSLAAVDSDMKYLMQEYHDGLLLYEISNREVWQKAENDVEGLKAFFEANRKAYAWPEPHFRGMTCYAKNKQDLKLVKRLIRKLPFTEWAEALKKTLNRDSIRVRAELGLFKPGDNALIDRKVFRIKHTTAKDNVPKDFPLSDTFGKKLKKGPDDYTDVRPQVLAGYQDMLEKAWIYDLRQRYPVHINENVLKTVNRH